LRIFYFKIQRSEHGESLKSRIIHLYGEENAKLKMEQTECSKTSACKIQMPGNYPEESIQQN